MRTPLRCQANWLKLFRIVTINQVVKKILVFIAFILYFYLFPAAILSAEEQPKEEASFATSYNVIYDIGLDGTATVTQKITLRNLTSQYYANQFKLTIGATEISDIKASDESGAMEVTSEKQGSSTTIAVKFNQQVAGLDKILPWTLQFKSKDFAEKIGKVWEIRAPKISPADNLESYNLTIQVPQGFGEPTLISPQPKTQTLQYGKIFLTFEKNQLANSGVLASFGTKQLFDFDLIYHLENSNLMPVLTNIALPPDSAFQDVLFQRIEPKPLNVTVDADGNYLAWYRLTRGQKMDVKVIGSAKLYVSSKNKNPVLDGELRKKYTSVDKYWERDHPQITSKLAEILAGKEHSEAKEKVKLIYRFVVDSLKYDSSRLNADIERFGALTVLNNPGSAVCMEFTDLCITLARAAGIPARELDGYAYSANPSLRPLSLNRDILHAWPEYFDEIRGWVMVDPTWENTTGGVDYFSRLDLNHFVFSIKGSSSTSPVPAGSYKYEGADSRDVKVTLSENDFLGKPQIDVKIETPGTILAGLPGKMKVKLINQGNALFATTGMLVSSDRLNMLDVSTRSTGPIPAYGEANFEFNVRTKSIFDSYEDRVTVTVAGQKYTKEISISPFFAFGSTPFVVFGLVGFGAVIYFSILGGLIIRRRVLKISPVNVKLKNKPKKNSP